MQSFTNLERLNTWIQPGNAGDDGGGSSKANGAFAMVPAGPPVAQFSIKGSYPYNNAYFYNVLSGDLSTATYFAYKMSVMFPGQEDIAACQAVEFELQQNVGSAIYNMAWQADLKGSKMWRTFDYTTSMWVPTDIAVNADLFTPGEWVDIEAIYLRSAAAKTLTHVSLSINGTAYPVNVTRLATPKVESNYVHAAIQFDSDSVPTPYNVSVDKISVDWLATLS